VDRFWENPLFVSDIYPQAVDKNPNGTSHNMEWLSGKDTPMTIKVAMVCMGNICRSPMAEHVLRGKVQQAGLDVTVVSGGTGGWHIGKDAHPRTQKVLTDNGYTSNHNAKQIATSWFDDYDYLIVMDKTNLSDVKEFARDEADLKKVSLLRDYDGNTPKGSEVPDPYYSDYNAYLEVFEMVDAACDGLVNFLEDK
jgi:protein-tyrosine phosphatase